MAELWFHLLIEELGPAARWIPPHWQGFIGFESRSTEGGRSMLGGLRINGAAPPIRVDSFDGSRDAPECTVVVDEEKIRTFFSEESVAAGTFVVTGERGLYEALLDAIDKKPKSRGWLEARLQ